jgi:hypothetical protein
MFLTDPILELRFICSWCRQVVRAQQASGYLGR